MNLHSLMAFLHKRLYTTYEGEGKGRLKIFFFFLKIKPQPHIFTVLLIFRFNREFLNLILSHVEFLTFLIITESLVTLRYVTHFTEFL